MDSRAVTAKNANPTMTAVIIVSLPASVPAMDIQPSGIYLAISKSAPDVMEFTALFISPYTGKSSPVHTMIPAVMPKALLPDRTHKNASAIENPR